LDDGIGCTLWTVTAAGGYRFFAGWRSDPFCFDTMGALNNLQFTGDDFFADKGLVQDRARSTQLCSGLWKDRPMASHGGRREREVGSGGPRGTASQSVFLPGDEKAAYQAGQPADDARFIPVFANSLEHAGDYTGEEAKRAAGILLPDFLLYDSSKPASYLSNARTPIDDAIDVFLPILTNGEETRDNVGPHGDPLTEFPYVGAPLKARSRDRRLPQHERSQANAHF
jgi:hypothetical protein